MSEVVLRPEAPADVPAIAAVVDAAFERPDESKLVADLRAGHALPHSLVAIEGERIVGHVALSPLSVQGAAMPGVLALAPLAVLPERQRQGIGSRLVEGALSAAKAEGAKVVLVLGDPAFYRRFGFRPAGGIGLTPPWPVPPEAFQAVILASPWPRGLVRYHPAFDRLTG